MPIQAVFKELGSPAFAVEERSGGGAAAPGRGKVRLMRVYSMRYRHNKLEKIQKPADIAQSVPTLDPKIEYLKWKDRMLLIFSEEELRMFSEIRCFMDFKKYCEKNDIEF